MRNNTANIWVYVLCLITVLLFTACSDIDGDLESKAKVNKKVAEQVPSEKYELVSVEHHDDERPKRDVYTYRSRERDLTFEAVSTLRAFGIDGATLGYNKYVEIGYVDAVHERYYPQTEELFSQYWLEEKKKRIYGSFDDLEEIARCIARLNDIYREELDYNSAEWMQDHPLRLSFEYEREDYPGYYSCIFKVDVDGSLDYDSVYAYITYKHAEAVQKGEIVDDTVPEAQFARLHRNQIEKVFYNGKNLAEAACEEAHRNGLYNNLDSSYYIYYYYPWDSYVVTMDCGLTDDKYAPKMMECYADAFGFPVDVQYKKGKIRWYYNGADYEIRAREKSRNEIEEFCISRDGEDLQIPYITNQDKISPIGATYVVGIPIEDFAALFDKGYRIDEEIGIIEFYDGQDSVWDQLQI